MSTASQFARKRTQEFQVGAIFVSTVVTDPATLLGYGTWSAVGTGRVLVGYDAGDADFNTLGGTGGAKTKAISAHSGADVAAHGWHSHAVGTIAAGAHSSHTHGTGTLATSVHSGTAVDTHAAALFDHLHNIMGTATISAHSGTSVSDHSGHTHVYSDVPNHTHPIASGQGSHSHSQRSYGSASGTLAGCIYDATSSVMTTVDLTTATATLPAMVTSNNTGGVVAPATTGPASITLSHSVTQPAAHTLGGQTGTNGVAAISHSVTQPSAHTMSGSTGSESVSLTHSMSGSTDLAYLSHSVTQPNAHSDLNVVQPYLVVRMWQRTA